MDGFDDLGVVDALQVHPARAAGLMLLHKGIEHELVNLTPGSPRLLLRPHGFRDATVPAPEDRRA